jgi:predicted transcriptional regulator
MRTNPNIAKSRFMATMGESLPAEQPVDYASAIYSIEPEIEIVSISDKRLKVLGEELSNENSCAILNCIMQGKKTAGEIATTLNLSLPLVVYHIQRLLQSKMIRIDGIELNSKGREKKIYNINKAAIIIQLNPDDPVLRERLKRLFMLSAAVAAIATLSLVWYISEIQNQMVASITDPDLPSTPQQISLLIPLALSSAAATVSAALAWIFHGRKK